MPYNGHTPRPPLLYVLPEDIPKRQLLRELKLPWILVPLALVIGVLLGALS